MVMAYNEDHQLILAMDWETTLMEEVSRQKVKSLIQQPLKGQGSINLDCQGNIAWHDSKEICISWNQRDAVMTKKCGHIHACLACKKWAIRNKGASPITKVEQGQGKVSVLRTSKKKKERKRKYIYIYIYTHYDNRQ